MKLYFVTGNLNKLIEARKYLSGITIENYPIKLKELQGDRQQITLAKAEQAANIIGKPCFVDDVSLCFTALKDLPGPYIKDFLERLSPLGLVKLLHGFKDKRAKAICTIGYCKPGKEARLFEGITHGKIVGPNGKKNFGWDPIFKPNGHSRTYAQMTLEEKNKINHRTKALKKMYKYLKKKEHL